jgi:hypothetical protein
MSDFLFAQSSFLSGVGSVIDLFGILESYNESANPQEADRRAFQADILALKNDMDASISRIR